MLFWLILAAMTGAAALILLGPLARARSAPDEAEADDVGFYRAALADIERDAARGLIGEAEAAAARTEAARRLLRSEGTRRGGRDAPSRGSRGRRRIASILALVAVPAIALSLYAVTGSPHLPDRPLAARRAADPATMDVEEAVRASRRIWRAIPKTAPASKSSRRSICASGASMTRRAPSPVAAHERRDARASRRSRRSAGRQGRRRRHRRSEAATSIARAANSTRTHAKARYYLALAREQDGDRAGAVAAFEDLLAVAPPTRPG